MLPPSGRFTRPALDGDFLLRAAGGGITPVISIPVGAHCGNRLAIQSYANRDEKSVIFAAELRELAARYADRLTVPLAGVGTGLPTRAQLGGFWRNW